MASYVARNGRDFESIVRAKGDKRFSFLDGTHIYNAYYKHKVKMYGGVVEDMENIPKDDEKPEENTLSEAPCIPEEKVEDEKKIVVEEGKTVQKGEKVKKIIAPVSFSIKKVKEPEAVTIERSALSVEESSEESENEETDVKEEELVVKQEEQTENCVVEEEIVNTEVKTAEVDETNVVEESIANEMPVIEIEDTAHELIDLTDDTEERRDARRAEDKIKDKLAAAAREKMSLISRNRELQIERKRRAAAFLSKIKPEDVSTVNGSSSVAADSQGDTKKLIAEEDDLLKRFCDYESELTISASTNNSTSTITTSTTTSHSNGRHKDTPHHKRSRSKSRSKSAEKYRHKSSRKKRKKRSSSSESPKKRSKHSHRAIDKKRPKKKHHHRSRSRSRSRSLHPSRSRSNSHRSSPRSRPIDEKSGAGADVAKRKDKKCSSHGTAVALPSRNDEKVCGSGGGGDDAPSPKLC